MAGKSKGSSGKKSSGGGGKYRSAKTGRYVTEKLHGTAKEAPQEHPGALRHHRAFRHETVGDEFSADDRRRAGLRPKAE